MSWVDKYPILNDYKEFEDIEEYKERVKDIIKNVQDKYKLSDVDTVLVVKDILWEEYKQMKKKFKKKKSNKE